MALTATEHFEVKSEPERCWRFLSDLSNIGSCIPGCESVTRLDDASAQFRVKVKVGYVSKTFEMKAKLEDIQAPTHLTFSAEGPDAEISGSLDIGSGRSNASNSLIIYTIEIRPTTVIGKTASSMMGKEFVKKQAREFATCVKSKLET